MRHKFYIAAVSCILLFEVVSAARAAERFEPAFETGYSKLGARFYINPQPQKLSWKQSPLGTFMDSEESFFAGVVVDGRAAALPFQKEMPQLDRAETAVTMTSGRYRGVHPAGVAVEMKITAPFYPRDVKLCDAPYFYIDLTVKNTSDARKAGTLFLGETFTRDMKIKAGVIGDSPALRADGGYGVVILDEMDRLASHGRENKIQTSTALVVDGAPEGLQPFTDKFIMSVAAGAKEKLARRSVGFTAPFDLAPGAAKTVRFILAAYTKENLLTRNDGAKYAFKYSTLFPDIESVVKYAEESRDRIIKKSGEFDALIEGMSLSDNYKIFLSVAFQSWMLNTWWMMSPKGGEWFSEMEGDCKFHSTIDVSYNTALIYYELWPELLNWQFDEWEFFAQDKKLIMHDLGTLQVLNGTKYSMPVEENANYLLMLQHYLAVTGDKQSFTKRIQLVRNMANFIADADTNGDGFPEEGNYNTYERKVPNPLGAEGVVYVAVKAYAAMKAVEELALEAGDQDLVKLCRAYNEKFKKTFDSRAWRGDHYSVCLQETIKPGQADLDRTLPRASYPGGTATYGDTLARVKGKDDWATNRDAAPLKYFDAYTILTSNGLLYLMRADTPYGLDAGRIKDDLVNASKMTWREVGNPHIGDPDDRGMWLSANIWRDMTASYLGLDWSSNFDAYRRAVNMKKKHNEGVFADSYFYDTKPQWEWDLTYYPRGITAIGVPSALAGMRIDAPNKTLHFKPVRGDLKFPLFMFADWEKGVVPWVTVSEKDGKRAVALSEQQLLGGWKVKTDE
jgi:hypothetical protein